MSSVVVKGRTDITRTRQIAVAVAALALVGGGVAAGWALDGGARQRADKAEGRLRAASAAASAAAAERDRIKADRDRLEARIAAQSAPPKACAEQTLSTAAAQLIARFAVDYPCGWHLLEDPLKSFADDTGERKGRMLDQLFLSALPISKAPRDGPLTEITVDTWYDDPNVEGDALPSLEDWIATAKKRFSSVSESTVTTRIGLKVTKLDGSMTLFDRPQPAVLYVWQWTGPDGTRRISEAFALEPGPLVARAIRDLVRSFRVLGA